MTSADAGSKKSLNVELNLVPFIDLMTVCVTFLLMTAVWTQTGRIGVDQSVQKPQPKQEQTEPPKRLIIMVDNGGYTVRFADEKPVNFPKVGGEFDSEKLYEHLKELATDGVVNKDQRVIVAPHDATAYKDVIATMESCERLEMLNLTVADIKSVAN